MKELVGKKVLDVMADPSMVYWRFITDQGDVDYYCEADCCSESWINHINGLTELIGGTVQGVEEIDFHSLLKVDPEPTKQEVDQVLFHRVKTEKGMCTFEFRNSSNGYYGGSLDLVSGQRRANYDAIANELVFIKEDF